MNDTDSLENMEERMAQYRREHFAVEVAPSRFHKNEVCLNVTHNGYQWSTISITDDEMPRIIEALQGFKFKP